MESQTPDSLARFHRVLVEEILRTRPLYLSEPFTVAEIYQDLVPYRTHHDRIGVEMNGDYEEALLRLLAAEGEYLLLESGHACREIRDELGSPNPTKGLYREYAAADVRLNPIHLPRDFGLLDPTLPDDPLASEVASPEGVDFPKSIEVEAPAAAHDEPLTACLWCREPLPRRETLNYCPFCSADLHTVPCPSCGEELEVEWRFCVACRTEVGGAG
jgi:hypothetical protein